MRAMDPQTQEIHIPHEVKASWAEGHVGHHFADLLQKTKASLALLDQLTSSAAVLHGKMQYAACALVWQKILGQLFILYTCHEQIECKCRLRLGRHVCQLYSWSVTEQYICTSSYANQWKSALFYELRYRPISQ